MRRVASAVANGLRRKAPSRTVTREFVMLSLESLKASSPVFPPLEGVVGGLMELINTYETMTQNEIDRQRLYEHIDTIQESLVLVWGEKEDHSTGPCSEARFQALERFGTTMQHILQSADALAASRQNVLRRFILARKHRTEVLILVSRLSEADDDLRRSIELDTNHRTATIQASITKSSETSSEQYTVLRRELRGLQTNLMRILIPSIAGFFARPV